VADACNRAEDAAAAAAPDTTPQTTPQTTHAQDDTAPDAR
jgi:hypothetical protein